MIDKNTRLEHGGLAKILGVWHSVFCSSTAPPSILTSSGTVEVHHLMEFIQDYDPPAPKPYDWSTDGESFGDDLNAALTARYGDPTTRTYSGEDAGRYGLNRKSSVLCFSRGDATWLECTFNDIDLGDQWRKQPPAPKGSTL